MISSSSFRFFEKILIVQAFGLYFYLNLHFASFVFFIDITYTEKTSIVFEELPNRQWKEQDRHEPSTHIFQIYLEILKESSLRSFQLIKVVLGVFRFSNYSVFLYFMIYHCIYIYIYIYIYIHIYI